MKTLSFLKPQNLILSMALLASTLCFSLSASDPFHDKVNNLISSCPWAGLVADRVTYGPVTISRVNIEDSGRLVFCKPGEKVEGSLRYKINSSKLESWHTHHILIGFQKGRAQSCITHSLGIWDKKGKARFTFDAPMEKGTYEICFGYYTAELCGDAMNEWDRHPPSHHATIGILVVE
ncbi:MAG: hypothetical protein ACXU9U_00090 [Parachlamydiaceae bacterium]